MEHAIKEALWAMRVNFDHILNWKLLSGSHPFPGPDGGTCINEAAIVAAGFAYNKVGTVADCPPCFSRPIAQFAIVLNDRLLKSVAFTDAEKQSLLMPFVLRLAGTADETAIENQRCEFLIIGLVRDCVSILLRGWLDHLSQRCAEVKTLQDVQRVTRDLALDLARALARDRDLARALDLALDLALDRVLDLARARDRARARDLSRSVFVAQINLLDGALCIGKQADGIDLPLVAERMEKAKATAVSEGRF